MRSHKSGFLNLNTVFIAMTVVFFLFFDKPVAVWMDIHMSGTWAYRFSKFIGVVFSVNNVKILAIVLAVISCLYLIRNYKDSAKPYAFVVLNFFIAGIIVYVLKIVFARYRPEMLFAQNLFGFSFFSLKHACNSFPSGHAIASFSIAVALFYIIREKSICWAVFIIAVIVGLSRIVITAHYCSDVIASLYIAILVAKFIDSIYQRR